MTARFVASAEFAELLGIHQRKAREALSRMASGRPFAPHHLGKGATKLVLQVHHQAGLPGGRGGNRYAVALADIPGAWIVNPDGLAGSVAPAAAPPTKALTLPPPAAAPASVSPAGRAPALEREAIAVASLRRLSKSEFRVELTSRMLQLVEDHQLDPRTIIRELTARGVCWPADMTTLGRHGSRQASKPIGAETLRRWLDKALERGGTVLVEMIGRRPRRGRRFVTWAALDAAMQRSGLDQEAMCQVANEIKLECVAFAAVGKSDFHIRQLARPHVAKILDRHGISLPSSLDDPVLIPSWHFLRGKPATRRARQEYERRTNARAAENRVPSIRRERPRAPGLVLEMDVRRLDILVERDDGSPATPWGLYLRDPATNYVAGSMWLLPPGEAFRREHVAQALSEAFAACPLGVPCAIVTDRGSEMKLGPALEDILKAAAMQRSVLGWGDGVDVTIERVGVHLTTPYQPKSKGIESLFGSLTRSFERGVPGYIHDDGVRHRTANKGKAPEIGTKGEDEARRIFRAVVGYYNTTVQQKGRIAGQSPAQAFEAFIARRWATIAFDEAPFALACGTIVEVKLHGGTIRLDGVWYSDGLSGRANGETIRVIKSLRRDPEVMFALDDEGRPTITLTRDPKFSYFSTEGGAEAGRRRALARKNGKADVAGARKVDLVEEYEAHAEREGPVTASTVQRIGATPALKEAAARLPPGVSKRPRQPTQHQQVAAMLKRQAG